MYPRYVNDLFKLMEAPDELWRYVATWKNWFGDLPAEIRRNAPKDAAARLTFVDDSVLARGWPTCPSWRALPTLQAFLDGVTRAIALTPAFCLLVIFICLADVPVCFATLYSIIAMIVSTLGLLYLLNVPLGAVEALSFAVVIGLSVDYLVHLAYAYKNALLPERYDKSRAAFLARFGSLGRSWTPWPARFGAPGRSWAPWLA